MASEISTELPDTAPVLDWATDYDIFDPSFVAALDTRALDDLRARRDAELFGLRELRARILTHHHVQMFAVCIFKGEENKGNGNGNKLPNTKSIKLPEFATAGAATMV